jgi:hypothetical protein
MKRTVTVFLFCLLVAARLAYAHPPSKMTVTFDKTTKLLTATITHEVVDPASHYIEQIEIMINGRRVLEHKISRQDNSTKQYVRYGLPDVKSGDKVAIKTYCSLSGSLTEEITVRL